jgi:hypothetical protein
MTEPLVFEQSRPGRTGYRTPECDVPQTDQGVDRLPRPMLPGNSRPPPANPTSRIRTTPGVPPLRTPYPARATNETHCPRPPADCAIYNGIVR